MEIKYENIDEVMKNLEAKFEDAATEKIVGQACAIVEAAAKEKAPKGSGALKRSIQYKVSKEDQNVVGTIFTPLEYAPYIEFGTGLFAEGGNGRKEVPWRYQDDEGEWHSTKGIKPHPFLRPAFTENKQKILKKLQEGAKDD